MDADFNALSEKDKEDLQWMKEKDHVLGIWNRYRKLKLEKKAYVTMRVLEENKKTDLKLEIALDLWEQRNIFDLQSSPKIELNTGCKRKGKREVGKMVEKQSHDHLPDKKRKIKESAAKKQEMKKKLLERMRKAFPKNN